MKNLINYKIVIDFVLSVEGIFDIDNHTNSLFRTSDDKQMNDIVKIDEIDNGVVGINTLIILVQ